MILESVLLTIVGTQALEFITRKLIASFADNDFWKDRKHKDTDKILLALAKK